MKIGFIESLKTIGDKTSKFDWKNSVRFVGKRTTVFDNPEVYKNDKNTDKRLSNQDSFQKFTKNILPQFEEKIEIDLLQQQFKNIQNEQLKNDLIQSYIRRRIKLYSVDGDEIEEITQEKSKLEEKSDDFINVITQFPLNSLTDEDIGFYVQYPLSDLEKYFKDGQFFGTYASQELIWTKKFALMANEESLKFVEYLKQIKNTHNQKFDLNEIFPDFSDSQDIQTRIQDEDVYFRLTRQFSLDLLEAIQPYRNDTMFERYFATPNIFDFIVRQTIDQISQSEQLCQDLANSEQRTKIFQNIAQQFLEKGDREQCNSQLLVEFMTTFQTIDFPLSNGETHVLNLVDKQLVKNKRRLPSSIKYFNTHTGINSGAMLYGDRGTGKSGTLAYVTMWAHKNDFVVVNVPSAYKLTNTKSIYYRHSSTGLYVQNDLAKEWLEFFLNGNSHLLEKIPINKELYGKINYSGLHDDDPVAVPNTFYKRRRAYFEDHKQFLFDEEVKLIEEFDNQMEVRLAEKLPEPKTLKELVEYGVENEWFACNVVGEVMEQVYNLESHCVLVVVDEYNYLYKESVYPSYRYANDKELDGHVPPYHLSLCRPFVNLDGHKIKNGFKLTASSVTKMQRHKFTPEKINMPLGYGVEMEGLPLDDFRKMCNYYLKNGLWNTDTLGENSIDYLWMQTQGNWGQAQQYMIDHYVDGYMLR